MKLSLQIKLGQQLTMTPQLQQAIKLLQLSTLDLQQEIQQALESNPMLELEDDFDTTPDTSSAPDSNTQLANTDNDDNRHTGDTSEYSSAESTSEFQPSDEDFSEGSDFNTDESWNDTDIPENLSTDSSWDDVFTNSQITGQRGGEGDDGDGNSDFDSRNTTAGTLQDHLMWQLNLTPMSDSDRAIATSLIDAIDNNGLLTTTVSGIHASLTSDFEIDEEEVLAVLHRIQQFDPVGVGYRDLKECLSVQLKHLASDFPCLDIAQRIIDDYLPQLASHDYNTIMRKLRIKEAELKAAIAIILDLNPRPGSEITPLETTYVIPDVFVTKHNNNWKVELNPDTAPRIRVNPDYAALATRGKEGDNTFLRDSLQEARWFIKSLQSRNETLLKVSTKIVEHQKNFFDYGEEAMKPLVLHDIAEAVSMHESTISRVTTQKYMHTPRGIFELKYFFSSHVDTDSGGECSSTAIRAIIKKLVAAENPRKPLSDNKIADVLADQGIQIARRTIAKYREALSIAPSNERKQLT
jgi:RNA polymerase sigma-54 factor